MAKGNNGLAFPDSSSPAAMPARLNCFRGISMHLRHRLRWSLVLLGLIFACRVNGQDSFSKVIAEPPKAVLKSLNVFPTQIDFTGPRDEQHIGVVGEYADGRQWELTRDAKYVSSDTKVAVIEGAGIVRPVGDGQATISVTVAGRARRSLSK